MSLFKRSLSASDLEQADIDDSTTKVNGFDVYVYTESYSTNSNRLTQRLHVMETGAVFQRLGFKVIEYGNWVDTEWLSWEEY